jgi:drug/metabolite transporter (DMT)-like permease
MVATLALLSSLLWGTGDFLAGRLSRRLPVLLVVGGSQASALVAVGVLAAVTGVAPPGRWLWWGVAAGAVGPVALGCFYRALAVGRMSVVAPLASLGVVLPVAVGLARGDTLTPAQAVGIGVAALGVVAAGGPDGRLTGGGRAVPLALAAAAGFGAVLVFLRAGSATDVVGTVLTQRLVNVLLVLGATAAVPALRGTLRTAPRPRAIPPGLVVVGLLDAAANLVFGVASRDGATSLVGVLGSLYPVATIALAAVVLRERLLPVQWVGVVGTVCGVVLLGA